MKENAGGKESSFVLRQSNRVTEDQTKGTSFRQ